MSISGWRVGLAVCDLCDHEWLAVIAEGCDEAFITCTECEHENVSIVQWYGGDSPLPDDERDVAFYDASELPGFDDWDGTPPWESVN